MAATARPGTLSSLSIAISEPLFSEGASHGLSIQVAQSLPEVEALRPIWNGWPHGLDTDIDYYLYNMTSDVTAVRPYVVTVWRGPVPVAMLVGRVMKSRVSAIVSFVNLQGPNATMLEIVVGGRIGIKSTEVDKLFVHQLRKALRTSELDFVCFHRIPMESDLFQELQATSFFKKEHVYHIFPHLLVPLTAAPGKSIRALSGKNRREIRRKTRILEHTFSGESRFRCFSANSELEAGLRDASVVDVTTWQHYLGGCALDTRQSRSKFEFCARKGWLRIYVMYIKDAPVAFLLGQQHQLTFYCQHAGYDPHFSRYAVGSLLTAYVFDGLAAAGIEQVDLGGGGQEHSRRLGARVYEEGLVHLYAPTIRGLCLKVFFTATKGVRRLGSVVRKELRLHKVSGAWTGFLLKRWNSRRDSLADPQAARSITAARS